MTTEEFIADCAKRGWSKTSVREALNLSRYKFYAMLEAMPPLPWPTKSELTRRSNAKRECGMSPALKEALEKCRFERKVRTHLTYKGVTGSIETLAKLTNKSARTIRRYMKEGMTFDEAAIAPLKPRYRYRRPDYSAGNPNFYVQMFG